VDGVVLDCELERFLDDVSFLCFPFLFGSLVLCSECDHRERNGRFHDILCLHCQMGNLDAVVNVAVDEEDTADTEAWKMEGVEFYLESLCYPLAFAHLALVGGNSIGLAVVPRLL